MRPQQIKAMKLALEALELLTDTEQTFGALDYGDNAITALKEALAQPEQEPVKMVAYNCTCGKTMKFESLHGVVAPQRTWVGLTDEEISELMDTYDVASTDYAQAIEAKLKKKNSV